MEEYHKFSKEEGFWYSKREPHYPMPVHSDVEHPRKKDILEAYDKLVDEDRFNPERNDWKEYSHVIGYRGFSSCRCCSKSNGSRQYVLNDWTWPQGFRHYIEAHNIVPSKEWLKDILNIEI